MIVPLLLLVFCCCTIQAELYNDRQTNLRSILYPTYSQRPLNAVEYYGNYELPSMGMWSGYNNLLNRNLRSVGDQEVLPRSTSSHGKQVEGFQLYPYYTGLGKGR
ncbi:hypothetical protein L596_006061 [Steinernema carpocapsae]|uniref:Uncharacterized protein n=1 Tax=Steinernema carpocapsae TaxID=34508 RepID=A0A4U8V0Z2_STECR|nr:hypothetical protein L596_006061 [Steinernema carpocapsae]